MTEVLVFTENFGRQTSRIIRPLGPSHGGASTGYVYDPTGDLSAANNYSIQRVRDTRIVGPFLHMGRGIGGAPNGPVDGVGDHDGNCITFNGSNTPGVFYQRTQNGLIIGRTYLFSVRYCNLGGNDGTGPTPGALPDPTQDPNITLRINDGVSGPILATDTTGFIPRDSAWHSIHVAFVAQSQSATYSCRNNSGANVGNDLALDQISISSIVHRGRPCCHGYLVEVP
jgi:hypothetical protein